MVRRVRAEKPHTVLAHGRSETLESDPEIRSLDQDYERHIQERPPTKWEERIGDQSFAQHVREDLDRLFRVIHEARPPPKDDLYSPGIHSSGGSIV